MQREAEAAGRARAGQFARRARRAPVRADRRSGRALRRSRPPGPASRPFADRTPRLRRDRRSADCPRPTCRRTACRRGARRVAIRRLARDAASCSGVASSSLSCASNSLRPRPASKPAPPSFVLLPPSATKKRRTPASSSARIASPMPRVLRASTGTPIPTGSVMPTISAVSMIALPSASRPVSASRSGPAAPRTLSVRRSPPLVSMASSVPSPPSAIGQMRTLRVGAGALDAGCDRLRDLFGAKRAFEGIGSNDDDRRGRRIRHGVSEWLESLRGRGNGRDAGAAPSAFVSLSAWARRLNMSNGIAGIVRGERAHALPACAPALAA